MALASQTARMTSNRSYMMSNVSRRRRRAQRRNMAIALLVVGSLIGVGVYALSGKDDTTAPPIENHLTADTRQAAPTTTSEPAPDAEPVRRAATNPLGPSTASAAQTQPTRTQETSTHRGALPDPEPIVRRDNANADAPPALRAPAADTPIPAGAPVVEMGRPTTTQTADRPTPTQPVQQASTTPSRSAPSGVIPASTGGAIADLLARADALVAQSKPVQARDILNRALFDRATTEADRGALRDRLSRLNETLVFGRAVVPGDSLASSYTIAPGDSLAKIASSQKLDVDWRFVAQVNGISDPRRIRVGQSIKLLKGPFHAVVYKSRFRLDLFANATDSAGNRLYIRSFPVGLGEYGSTPTGSFVVRPNSKLINPVWTNPRTGEYFGADNPANPIGEHWVGLDPANDASAAYTQYGLHGTIEPDSIGSEKSMGCVRLASPDIELLYGMLVETKSTVEILP